MYELTSGSYVLKDGVTKIPIGAFPDGPNTNPDFLEYQAWLAVGNTPSPAQPSPEERMAAAKAARQVAVDGIKVTTQAGHTFDGDEVSQGRMARAILALDAAGQASTTWVLSNNTPTSVTRDDLQQALVLAGQEQTRLWLLPWEPET